jgi:hypothetical protein
MISEAFGPRFPRAIYPFWGIAAPSLLPPIVDRRLVASAVADSMGHVDLKSMAPYQHQELCPLGAAINERNRTRKEGLNHAAGSGPGHISGHSGQATD